MPRTKNQPPPDHDENRLLNHHAGAVEWMPPVGTWDPERGGIVPHTEEELQALREREKKAHAARQRRLQNR